MLALPCLAALSLIGVPPADEVAPAAGVVEVGGGARAGASAGHVWVAPFALALPGGGGDVKLTHRIRRALYGHGRLGFSVGVDESGTVGGGYRARGGLGLEWIDVGWFAFASEAHMGLSSFSLIPVPALGVRAAARLRPVRLEHFLWEIGADVEPELLIIVPRLKVGAHTAVIVPIGAFHVGLAGEADAEAIVAVVANVVSATAGVRLFAGFSY